MTEKSALSSEDPKLSDASSSGILLAALGTLAALPPNAAPVLEGRVGPDVLGGGGWTLDWGVAIGTGRV